MNSQTGFWEGRSVLITGSTGLLGSWLTPALVRRGAHVVALVRSQGRNSFLERDGWLDRISTVRGCLGDAEVLKRVFSEHRIKTVFHLGAQTLVGEAKTDPVGTLETNVRGTWLLLEAARQAGVDQLLIASSCKAYGDSDQVPYREDHPLQGRSPYDVSKTCTDLVATMYAHSFSLPAVIVRCSNLFGGGDMNFCRLIPGVILATLKNEAFRIRSDGSTIRDFLYVEDAVDAYLWLAECMAADPSLRGEAFNFGLQLRCTMLEITEKVLSFMRRSELRPVIQNVVSKDDREQTLDSTKARERLRWLPKYGLDEGIRLTIDWYTQNLGLSLAGKRQEMYSSVGT